MYRKMDKRAQVVELDDSDLDSTEPRYAPRDLNQNKKNSSVPMKRKKMAVLKLNHAPIIRQMRSPKKIELSKIGSSLISELEDYNLLPNK